MTLADSIHTQRLRVLRDAEHLGNVSEAAGGMAYRGRCFIDCGSALNSTAATACILNGTGQRGAARRRSPSTRSVG